jgi:hypothetical protein
MNIRRFQSTILAFVTISCLALALANPSYAANHYIRVGATGSNNGSDWTNAWTAFPSAASWIRGDFYYIAGGTYTGDQTVPSRTGTSWLTVKRATVSDHGASTGWNDSYDAQVFIKGTLFINGSYVCVDGITGNRDSGYGIKVATQGTAYASNIGVLIADGLNYVNISHIEVQGGGVDATYDNRGVQASSSSPVTGYHFSYIYVHDISTNGITLNGQSGDTIIEHCRIERARSGNPNIHGQGIQLTTPPMNNIVIRYNEFVDVAGTACVALLGANGGTFSDIYIYGNLIWNTDRAGFSNSPGAFYGRNAVSQTRVLVFNNTFYNKQNPQTYMSGDVVSGNESRNNAYINCDWYSVGKDSTTTFSNNYYYGNIGGRVPSGETGQVNGTGNPLVGAPANFHLTSTAGTIDKGAMLSSSFAADFDGISRPKGAGWDIGAFEYVSGTLLAPPTGLRVVK